MGQATIQKNEEQTMKYLATLLTAGFLLASCAAVASGHGVLLGERHVTDLGERDTIRVGAERGKFRGLRVKVTGSAVEFKTVVVHFENGDEQVFARNRVLGKGDSSREIDIQGGARFIEKVVFHYEARSKGWKGAELKLFGIRP